MTPARSATAWALAALALAAATALVDSSRGLMLLTQIGIAAIACLSYNLLLGQGGMLSFGHALYTGAGAYLAIHAMRWIGDGRLPLPMVAVPLVGALAGLGLAWLTGWLATRLSGSGFAMVTLGLGELALALALMLPDSFGGDAGVAADRTAGAAPGGFDLASARQVCALVLLHAWVAAALLAVLQASSFGRLLNAVRDNALRVGFLGFDARRLRHRAFTLAGGFAGLAGGLAALAFEIVTVEVLGPARSAAYLLFTVVGGSAFFLGPVLGAVLLVLTQVLLGEATRAWLFYLGALFLGVLLFAPGGLAGIPQQWRRWRHDRPATLQAALAGAVASAVLGGVVLTELLYHHQLRDTLGARQVLLGWEVDITSPAPWLGALLLLAAGAAAWRLLARRLARDGDGGGGGGGERASG